MWGGRIWLRNSETLVFAVGEANGLEARFAARLATVLKNNSSRLRLKIVPNGDNAKALAQFDRKEANLAILRTDARIPPRARALAILEHDLLLLISPGGKKIKSHRRAEEKEDRGPGRRREQRARWCAIFSNFRTPRTPRRGSRWRRRTRPSTSCSPAAIGAVVEIAHASQIVKDKSYEQYARRGGFTLNAIDAAKAIARKNPGISEETVATGMLSSSPAVPEDDLDTIGLEWLLVAQSKLSTTTVGDLARIDLREQGRARAATTASPPRSNRRRPTRTPSSSRIQGAAEYINDDTKSFIDRYSDLMYVGAGRAQHHRLDLCRASTPR